MTDADLTEAERLANAATPEVIDALRRAIEFYVAHWYVNNDGGNAELQPDSPIAKAIDAAALVPALIAEVRRLRAKVVDLEERLDSCCELCLDKCPHVPNQERTDV